VVENLEHGYLEGWENLVDMTQEQQFHIVAVLLKVILPDLNKERPQYAMVRGQLIEALQTSNITTGATFVNVSRVLI